MARIDKQEQGFVFTGWHMLAIMVLFFGTVIGVNLFMAWNATRSWSGLVVPNTYIASQQFNGKVAEARALAASGIEGAMTIADGRVAYEVLDAKGEPVVADAAVAIFKRPVDERADFTLTLTPAGRGQFGAERVIPPGQWVVDISTTNGGEKVFHPTVRTVVPGGGK